MILASHMIIGVAAARLVPNNPYLGFFLGIVSHFIVDAIPHSEYPLRSVIFDKDGRVVNMSWNKDFMLDLLKISADIIIGAGLVFIIFKTNINNDVHAILAGIAGGVFPDGLQFLYFKIKKEPLIAIQKFHQAIQAKNIFSAKGGSASGGKNKLYQGILMQIIIAATAIFASMLLKN